MSGVWIQHKGSWSRQCIVYSYLSWPLLLQTIWLLGCLKLCGRFQCLWRYWLLLDAFCWIDFLCTRVNLSRRGIIVGNHKLSCVFCFDNPEKVDHLFFSCLLSYQVWISTFGWLGFIVTLQNTGFVTTLYLIVYFKEKVINSEVILFGLLSFGQFGWWGTKFCLIKVFFIYLLYWPYGFGKDNIFVLVLVIGRRIFLVISLTGVWVPHLVF